MYIVKTLLVYDLRAKACFSKNNMTQETGLTFVETQTGRSLSFGILKNRADVTWNWWYIRLQHDITNKWLQDSHNYLSKVNDILQPGFPWFIRTVLTLAKGLYQIFNIETNQNQFWYQTVKTGFFQILFLENIDLKHRSKKCQHNHI